VSDFTGEQNWLNSGQIVCGNPKVFSQLLPLVKDVHNRPIEPAA
jgi:hypothetical protein